MPRIICKCRNCGQEFCTKTLTQEEFDKRKDGVMITSVYSHPCQGSDAPDHYSVVGIANVIRIEDVIDKNP